MNKILYREGLKTFFYKSRHINQKKLKLKYNIFLKSNERNSNSKFILDIFLT